MLATSLSIVSNVLFDYERNAELACEGKCRAALERPMYAEAYCKGIHEMHMLGILVLNIKPTNLLLDEHDQVVLGDFGIP
ncbi:hypothetical protein L1987_82433 [Smallanthus sonchifolius]|uniref:Uncharacterized protein n=1 Tax=Smallanthus sonchifolius TaxID=185202 RepID=A0ACB8YB72_9ASTR|nr:hypothetical protein L1987_82433 [Smallanthus sonchifolius]